MADTTRSARRPAPRERQSERDLGIIARVSRSLLETLDLDEQLGLTITLATEALMADRGSIMLLDASAGELFIASAEGLPEEAMSRRVALGEGIAGWVAQNNEPVVLHGDVMDPRFEGVNPSIETALSLPLSQGTKVLGVLNLVRNSGIHYTEDDLALATSLSDLAALAIEKAQLYTALAEREARMSRLLAAAIGAQEQERRRVAAEIHDGFLQDLSALFLVAEKIKMHILRGEVNEVNSTLEALQDSIRHEVAAIREFIFEVRPPSLDEIGLGPTVRSMVDRMAGENGLDREFVDGIGDERLSESLETILYRTAQEALRNVIKHAHAKKVWVSLGKQENRAVLLVVDDGVGVTRSDLTKSGHYGVDTMRERLELAGGDLQIAPLSPAGTQLVATLPLG